MITEPTPQYEFFGSCARGTEGLLAAELTSLGAQRVRPLQAGVAFFGTLEAGYRACLWSRIASRVLLVLGRVAALDADELYASVLEIDWESHIDPARTIAVSARGGNAALVDTMFIALKVKDALCDRFREKCGIRPSVEKDRPDVRIDVLVHNKRATISLDLAGEPLHMRGYRVPSRHIVAPIRETIAATMLLAASWGQSAIAGKGEKASGYEMLLDPLCGSGTIAIEAALIALDRAPGALRDYWGFSGLLEHDEDLWVDLLDEADNRAELALERYVASSAPPILASDIDPIAVEVARASARRAGVESAISFSVADVNDAGALIASHDETLNNSTSANRRLVVTNPPYAHRLSTLSQLPPLYAALRALIDPALTETSCDLCVITADEGMEAYLGQAPVQRIATFNGAIEVEIALYSSTHEQEADEKGSEDSRKREACGSGFGNEGLSDASSDAPCPATRTAYPAVDQRDLEQFENRLGKMAVHRAKWARRSGVTCYRVYDADLPSFAVAIDLYEGAGPHAGRRWLHIAEYAPPKHIDAGLAMLRLAAVLNIAPRLLGVPLSQVYLKTRQRAKGGSQYAELKSEESVAPASANTSAPVRAAASSSTRESASKSQSPAARASQAARSVASAKALPQKEALPPTSWIIGEVGLLFEVDFSSHLDTGIFLDHRLTRALLKEKAGGKDALNLFAYTGTASVYMAAGGAKTLTTVDLSRTYLGIAQRNMARNGFSGQRYPFEQADVLQWVRDHRHDAQKYGLIFCDPPTFSNSSAMGNRSWDVQRDHAELLIALSRMLTVDGCIVFSTNLRDFAPELEPLTRAGVVLEDISAQTIPPDFERNQKIHRCYLVRRTKGALPHKETPIASRPSSSRSQPDRQHRQSAYKSHDASQVKPGATREKGGNFPDGVAGQVKKTQWSKPTQQDKPQQQSKPPQQTKPMQQSKPTQQNKPAYKTKPTPKDSSGQRAGRTT